MCIRDRFWLYSYCLFFYHVCLVNKRFSLVQFTFCPVPVVISFIYLLNLDLFDTAWHDCALKHYRTSGFISTSHVEVFKRYLSCIAQSCILINLLTYLLTYPQFMVFHFRKERLWLLLTDFGGHAPRNILPSKNIWEKSRQTALEWVFYWFFT